jgi:hypothetical protein
MREPYSSLAAFNHLVLSGDFNNLFHVVGVSNFGSTVEALDQLPRRLGAQRVRPEQREAGLELATGGASGAGLVLPSGDLGDGGGGGGDSCGETK